MGKKILKMVIFILILIILIANNVIYRQSSIINNNISIIKTYCPIYYGNFSLLDINRIGFFKLDIKYVIHDYDLTESVKNGNILYKSIAYNICEKTNTIRLIKNIHYTYYDSNNTIINEFDINKQVCKNIRNI